MKPRDYQEAAINAIFDYFAKGGTGNPLVAMPTGTGKSIVIDEFIRRAYLTYPGQRIIKLTHVKELISQNFATLMKLWPTAPAGIYSAGLGRKDSCFPITFAGIASVVNCPEIFGHVDLVLIDEAHLVSPKSDTMYQTFLQALRQVNPSLKIIGFTATHYRLGQGLLTEEDGIFTDVCFDLTGIRAFNWLLEEGYLVPLMPKRTKVELDTTDVKVHGGEFVQRELQEAVDHSEITYATLKETIDVAGAYCNHWLVFASGIEHAIHISDMLESLNVSSTVVHSKLDSKTRDQRIAEFRAGHFTAMVNNGILTTGFDYPEIDLIVMLRPTQSPGLWVQMLGRGTRPVFPQGEHPTTAEDRRAAITASPKRHCLVLDFAGNTKRLGPINDPVIPKRKGKGGGGEPPVKLCNECGIYNHASVRFCTCCGIEFPRQVKIKEGASTVALIAVDKPQVETFAVNKVTYVAHKKQDRAPSIRVSYYCGLRRFEEWVCLEHLGFAKTKAREWWRHSAGTTPPSSTSEGLSRLSELKVPTSIRVWINKPHPEVLSRVYEQSKDCD